MDGARTRGHAPALAAIEGMVRGGAPHALLLSRAGRRRQDDARDGPRGRAALRPTRTSRHGPAGRAAGAGCSSMATIRTSTGSRPAGPGGQVVIGGPDAEGPRRPRPDRRARPHAARRDGARVAIIEAAHRMNEDAQAALLKTLEEPPAGRHPRPVRRRRGPAAADRPLALRAHPARAGRRRATSRRSSASTAWPTRPRRPGSPASPAGRPGIGDRLRPRPGGGPDPGRARADPAGPARRRDRPAGSSRCARPSRRRWRWRPRSTPAWRAAQASGEVAADATARRPGKRGSTAAGAAVPAATAEPADVAADAPA